LLCDHRVASIKLPHLAERTPTEVAVIRVPEIGVSDSLIAAGEIRLRSEFVRNALVLSKAVLTRRSYGLFIEALGVQFPVFDAGDLGADQCRAVPEILGAILSPRFERWATKASKMDCIKATYRALRK